MTVLKDVRGVWRLNEILAGGTDDVMVITGGKWIRGFKRITNKFLVFSFSKLSGRNIDEGITNEGILPKEGGAALITRGGGWGEGL